MDTQNVRRCTAIRAWTDPRFPDSWKCTPPAIRGNAGALFALPLRSGAMDDFHYRDGELYCEGVRLSEVAAEVVIRGRPILMKLSRRFPAS